MWEGNLNELILKVISEWIKPKWMKCEDKIIWKKKFKKVEKSLNTKKFESNQFVIWSYLEPMGWKGTEVGCIG